MLVHNHTQIFVWAYVFNSFEHIPMSKIVSSYDMFMFNLLGNFQIVFQSGYNMSPFHRQCTRVPISVYLHQRLFLSYLFQPLQWLFRRISLMNNRLSLFSRTYWPHRSLGQYLFMFFLLFLDCVVCLSVIEVFFVHSGYQYFIRFVLCKYFSPNLLLVFLFS